MININKNTIYAFNMLLIFFFTKPMYAMDKSVTEIPKKDEIKKEVDNFFKELNEEKKGRNYDLIPSIIDNISKLTSKNFNTNVIGIMKSLDKIKSCSSSNPNNTLTSVSSNIGSVIYGTTTFLTTIKQIYTTKNNKDQKEQSEEELIKQIKLADKLTEKLESFHQNTVFRELPLWQQHLNTALGGLIFKLNLPTKFPHLTSLPKNKMHFPGLTGETLNEKFNTNDDEFKIYKKELNEAKKLTEVMLVWQKLQQNKKLNQKTKLALGALNLYYLSWTEEILLNEGDNKGKLKKALVALKRIPPISKNDSITNRLNQTPLAIFTGILEEGSTLESLIGRTYQLFDENPKEFNHWFGYATKNKPKKTLISKPLEPLFKSVYELALNDKKAKEIIVKNNLPGTWLELFDKTYYLETNLEIKK
jgi:hypothetical protein